MWVLNVICLVMVLWYNILLLQEYTQKMKTNLKCSQIGKYYIPFEFLQKKKSRKMIGVWCCPLKTNSKPLGFKKKMEIKNCSSVVAKASFNNSNDIRLPWFAIIPLLFFLYCCDKLVNKGVESIWIRWFLPTSFLHPIVPGFR